jgi:hypothetical protein
MRAYQQDTTTASADRCSLMPVGRSLRTVLQLQGHTGQATGQATGAERYAVPHSPGCARRSYPYPLGRRRGRR